MEAISVLGFLAFFGALIYMVYHFIRKAKNRERTLPKKKFYPVLIGGFALFLIGSSFTDTSVRDELNATLESNVALTTENEKVQSANKKLEKENVKLKEENDAANKEVEDLTLKLVDFNKSEEELVIQQTAHKEKMEALGKEIADLNATNTTLTTEVTTLKSQASSKSASSSGGGSSTPVKTPASTPAAASSESESFQNCTELRKKYPSGVASDHPAYQSKMDRDKDGFACEK